jgi:hypothetical protein
MRPNLRRCAGRSSIATASRSRCRPRRDRFTRGRSELLESSTPAERSKLAAILMMEPISLEQKLVHGPAPFVWLRRRLSPDRAHEAEALGLEGVGALSEYKRFYPESNLAASVVGLAGMDGQGLSGIELQYDRLIRGEPVKLRIYHDALGHPILDSPLALQNAEPGGRVELTIDSGIQALAESRLVDEVRESGAHAGSAIVLDPFSGRSVGAGKRGSGRGGRSRPASRSGGAGRLRTGLDDEGFAGVDRADRSRRQYESSNFFARMERTASAVSRFMTTARTAGSAWAILSKCRRTSARPRLR